MSRVNLVLKAVFAGVGAGVAILVGSTVDAGITSWGDISVNLWLTALGAALSMFSVVYFVPNSDVD